MNYLIRPMILEDLPQVARIEANSFPHPWPEDIYQQELTVNPVASYLVLFQGQELLGYVGVWLIVGEIHLATIAVRPDLRRNGIGEVLLAEVIDLAFDHGADLITLEVREHNIAARKLYQKYGFVEVGVRRRYYTETGEDAILMNAEDITSEEFQQNFQRLKRASAARRI